MKDDISRELLTVKGNGDDHRIGNGNFGGLNPDDGIIGFVHWFHFPSCESNGFIASSLLIKTLSKHRHHCVPSDRACKRHNIAQLRVFVIHEFERRTRDLPAPIDCDFDIVPKHLISHYRVALRVEKRGRVTLHRLSVHYRRISKDCLVKNA